MIKIKKSDTRVQTRHHTRITGTIEWGTKFGSIVNVKYLILLLLLSCCQRGVRQPDVDEYRHHQQEQETLHLQLQRHGRGQGHQAAAARPPPPPPPRHLPRRPAGGGAGGRGGPAHRGLAPVRGGGGHRAVPRAGGLHLHHPQPRHLHTAGAGRGLHVGYTARSAEVEPPGLGSKCGKRVERFSDFGKYKGYIRNHSTSLPAYRT